MYDMSSEIAAGKKANTVLEIEKKFFTDYGITEAKYVELMLAIHDVDTYDTVYTDPLRIETNLYDGTFNEIVGTEIYNENGITVDYMYTNENEVTYCVTNNTDVHFDMNLDKVSVNDYAITTYDFNWIDITSMPVFAGNQILFSFEPSDEIIELNGIEKVEKVEFVLSCSDMQNYMNYWDTGIISAETRSAE